MSLKRIWCHAIFGSLGEAYCHHYYLLFISWCAQWSPGFLSTIFGWHDYISLRKMRNKNPHYGKLLKQFATSYHWKKCWRISANNSKSHSAVFNSTNLPATLSAHPVNSVDGSSALGIIIDKSLHFEAQLTNSRQLLQRKRAMFKLVVFQQFDICNISKDS